MQNNTVIVAIFVPRKEVEEFTNNTMSSMRLTKNSSKSKIPNLHFPLVSINKYIVTFQIPVYYRGVMTVQVEKTSQNLPRPVLHSLYVHMLMSFPIPGQAESLADASSCYQTRNLIAHYTILVN